MASVGIHPPKTPVTKGCNSIAKATIPNVCKMPGPPAPFVPSPLPNIAKSGMSPKNFSKTVKIENSPVAIRGASYKSMGDMASKGTGGGLISANTHGPAKFIMPGSLTVKIEGKNVHLLGEPMLNNCGPSGSPPNTGACMMGTKHQDADKDKSAKEVLQDMVCDCDEKTPRKKGQSCMSLGIDKHDCVDEKIKKHNKDGKKPQIGNESGWTEQEDPITGEVIVDMIGIDRGSMRRRRQLGGTRWPDAVSFDANRDPQQIFDFKFKCPDSSYPGMVPWGDGQEEKYRRLTRQWGKDPNEYPPTRISNTDC